MIRRFTLARHVAVLTLLICAGAADAAPASPHSADGAKSPLQFVFVQAGGQVPKGRFPKACGELQF